MMQDQYRVSYRSSTSYWLRVELRVEASTPQSTDNIPCHWR
jgi:hypothetical protein